MTDIDQRPLDPGSLLNDIEQSPTSQTNIDINDNISKSDLNTASDKSLSSREDTASNKSVSSREDTASNKSVSSREDTASDKSKPNEGDVSIQITNEGPSSSSSSSAEDDTSSHMVLNIPANPDEVIEINKSPTSESERRSETESLTESSDRKRVSSRGSDSESVTSTEERRGTFTKKIPLSEFATLQGILAHQVDEGAPCLRCEPGQCSGLELHFWKKVCKSCGCPRGAHKIQRIIEDKKETPRSILIQTADEDEEDYKEIEIAAPPKGFLLQSKSDRENEAQYNEEYINRLKEFYSGRRSLNIPEEEKLSTEQIFILQNYINQTQGTQVISPEVLQNSLHSLSRNNTPGYEFGSDDNVAIKRTQSVSSILSSDSDVSRDKPKILQALQLLTIEQQGHLVNRSPSPAIHHPILTDPSYNAATADMSGDHRSSPERKETPSSLDRSDPIIRRDDDYSDSRSEDSLTDSRSHSDYTSSEGSRSRSDYTTTEDSYTKELSTVNEEDEHTRSSKNAQLRGVRRRSSSGRHSEHQRDGQHDDQRDDQRDDDNSTIDMIDRITDVSRIANTDTVIKMKRQGSASNSSPESPSRSEEIAPRGRSRTPKGGQYKEVVRNRGYSDRRDSSPDSLSNSRSGDDIIVKAPPPKPIRRNPGSFEDLTQGDIIDYYTNVNPSGEPAPSQSMKRKGSPGVWVPPGLDAALVKQYLAALPEDKRPVNTLGVQWRIKQLQTQLPRYDHNINYCHEMCTEEQDELFMFVENRKEKAQGQGEVKAFRKKDRKKCDKCGGLVDVGIIAEKVPGKAWHPGCFCCNTCSEILVDLIYFQHEGILHCGRHHAELLRPRCHACDELIFGYEFITADNHEYHKEHFCCWECDTSLGGTRYVSHKGQPYCQICYEKLFCQRCVSCKEPIGVGMPVYKHGPLRWHGNPSCYACSFCKRSLVNRTFMPTERYVYCSKNCYRCHDSLRKTKGK